MNQRKVRKLLLASIPFETERLIVRYITTEDLYDMYEYSAIPKVSEFLLWSPHLNIETTKGYISSLQTRYLKGLYADWAIVSKEHNKMIGTIGFAALDTANKKCEIGYVLSPKFWGNGYITEALTKMLYLTFEVMCLEKATLRIIKENTRSIKLAKRFGFKYEFSINMDIKGEIREVMHFALCREYYENSEKKKQS